jgi:protein-tyrosine phosphatase
MIDIHSHVLPRVDDGSDSMSESLEILKGLAEQGTTDIIATPHYVNGSTYMSPAVYNRQLLQALNYQLKQNKINIRVYLGNELYIDRDLAELIRKGYVSTMANSHYVLVELPMSGEFHDYDDIIYSLQYQGYKVILAHPERYHSFQKDFSRIEELVQQGILLQCNLGSILGQYGRSAKKTIKKLAKAKYIFALGSDIHRKRDYTEITRAQKKLSRYYKKDQFEEILVKNPSDILREGLAYSRAAAKTAAPKATVRKVPAARKVSATRKPTTRKTVSKPAAK